MFKPANPTTANFHNQFPFMETLHCISPFLGSSSTKYSNFCRCKQQNDINTIFVTNCLVRVSVDKARAAAFSVQVTAQ